MKRLIAYFITISLLLGCVGNAKEATAQAKIQATVKDMSGVKRKLTMDSVEKTIVIQCIGIKGKK